MSTPTGPLPLHIVRAVAQSILDDFTAHRDEEPDTYWIARLHSSLQQMVDATTPEGDPK